MELIQKLLEQKFEVYISAPQGDKAQNFINMGCYYIDTAIDRRGISPIKDLKLLCHYIKTIKRIAPDIVLTYTIKPNIYGAIACRLTKTCNINTVTGLGSVYIRDIWIKKILIKMNRWAFQNSNLTYFLNADNERYYKEIGILENKQKTRVVHGSGANLSKFKNVELEDKGYEEFTFIGRILRDKGIEEYLECSRRIKCTSPTTIFNLVGSFEEDKYEKIVKEYEKEGIIVYHGGLDDVRPIIERSTCIVLPSYGEGCGTVLQEGAAVARPLISCDTYGCRDNVQDGYNGYLCKAADADSLEETMRKFMSLPFEQKKQMGLNSRIKAESEFDRNVIVQSYLEEIQEIIGTEVNTEK